MVAPIDLDSHLNRLRDYYARHGAIPSTALLAELWGYRAKSWAARIVARLLEAGYLEVAPGRRLRPGARFFVDDARVSGAGSVGEVGCESGQEGGRQNGRLSERGMERNLDREAGRSARASGKRRRQPDPIDAALSGWRREIPERDVEAFALAVRIVSTAVMMDRGFKREAAGIGINAGEILVLDALLRMGPPYQSSPSQLKDQFLISFAGVGKRLDRLEQRGFVERLENPTDRRGSIIRLTGSGLDFVRKNLHAADYAPHIQAILKLNATQREVLDEALKSIQESLEGERDPL